MWKIMEKDPEFHPHACDANLSLDEQKRRTARQSAKFNYREIIGDVDDLESITNQVQFSILFH